MLYSLNSVKKKKHDGLVLAVRNVSFILSQHSKIIKSINTTIVFFKNMNTPVGLNNQELESGRIVEYFSSYKHGKTKKKNTLPTDFLSLGLAREEAGRWHFFLKNSLNVAESKFSTAKHLHDVWRGMKIEIYIHRLDWTYFIS